MALAQKNLPDFCWDAGKKCPLCKREIPLATETAVCPVDGALLVPMFKDELLGTVLEQRFNVEKTIGRGGWSTVYYGHDLEKGVPVAIKVLRREFVQDDEKILRFQREAYVISNFKSPHLSEIYKYGLLSNGAPYIAMEYVVGSNLADLVGKKFRLTLVEILTVMLQVCDALAVAHRAGVVHRDIKPSNIMIAGGGSMPLTAKVIDFGLSCHVFSPSELTKTGETLGSPAYMSPEQCYGKRLDGRSDIYSLGCVMFEVLTGEKPFATGSTLDAMSQHIYSKPKPFEQTARGRFLPQAVRQVILRCLEKDAACRYQRVEELSDALGDALLVAINGEPDAQQKLQNAMSWPAQIISNVFLFFSELFKALGLKSGA
jgi:serine/threonine-protein kinase